jgi:hypothetical protein
MFEEKYLPLLSEIPNCNTYYNEKLYCYSIVEDIDGQHEEFEYYPKANKLFDRMRKKWHSDALQYIKKYFNLNL